MLKKFDLQYVLNKFLYSYTKNDRVKLKIKIDFGV